MTSPSICASCRRAMLAQWRQSRQLPTLKRKLSPLLHLKSTRPFSSTLQKAQGAPPPQPYQSKQQKPAQGQINETPNDEEPYAPSGAVYQTPTSAAQGIAQTLRGSLPRATETYVAYGACQKLVKECARQATYTVPQASQKGAQVPKTSDGQELGVGEGWWYDTLGLPPTFNTWAQVTHLHMYFLTVRFRCFPADYVKPWHQHLIDQFSNLAEDKMITNHNIDMRALRSRYLKDLFEQWRGIQAGYDEGLVKGDAVLATAVWRNIFKANPEVDFRRVGEVVSYIRHVLGLLQDVPDEDVASGEVAFEGDPGSERGVVCVRSRLMDSPAPANVAATGAQGFTR